MRTACVLALLLSAARADEPKRPTLVVAPDAFATLVNPNCSHCKDEAKRRAGDLRDDDRVLCWVRGYSDGGAIPFRFFLAPYRVISDSYGVFVYDPDAGYARGFAPSFHFRFHGWRNGVMVMRHKDGTLYSCLTGVAFDGPRKGDRLAPVPTLVSDWGRWLKRYPDAVAYHMFDKYRPVELPDKEHPDSVKSRGPADPRLPAGEMVLGVWTGTQARAYPLAEVHKKRLVRDEVGGVAVYVLCDPKTNTAAAYRCHAHPPRKHKAPRPNDDGVSPPDEAPEVAPSCVTLKLDAKNEDAPFTDEETGSRWDVAGRCVEGKQKGATLEWLDGTQVKWFAWAAEHPKTTVFGAKEDKAKLDDKVREIAGSAEFLRSVPKHFAELKAVDAARRQVTLVVEGEKLAKVWALAPDAEVKVHGWWGRLDQLRPGDRVWAWFKLDRQNRPASLLMLADEMSEQDGHDGGLTVTARTADALTVKAATPKDAGRTLALSTADLKKAAEGVAAGKKVFAQTAGGKVRQLADADTFEKLRLAQRSLLARRWASEGLPGMASFLHISGEMDFLLDHEAMRWGRSLKPGDKVDLMADPPFAAVVKSVKPWRERTLVRLVVKGSDQADLKPGDRLGLKMPAPPAEVLEASLPPDIDRLRNREERVEWFLASIYCTCGVKGDVCTGHFYTLASCNPNGCGMPNAMRQSLAKKIDRGLTDRQIFEELLKTYGPLLTRPHLLP